MNYIITRVATGALVLVALGGLLAGMISLATTYPNELTFAISFIVSFIIGISILDGPHDPTGEKK